MAIVAQRDRRCPAIPIAAQLVAQLPGDSRRCPWRVRDVRRWLRLLGWGVSVGAWKKLLFGLPER